MAEKMHLLYASLRQRVPCAGLFLSAVLGVLISDTRPGCWIIWSAVTLLPIALVCKVRSSLLAYLSIVCLFASWHGCQVATNAGYQRSRQTIPDLSEHTVSLVVETEPKIDQYLSTQRFIATVTCIDNQPSRFPVSAECTGVPLFYGDELIAQGKFSVPKGPMNPGEFDYQAYLSRKNVYLNFRSLHNLPVEVIAHHKGNPLVAAALCLRHRLADTLQAGLQDDSEVAQTIQGMVLGARSETSPVLKKLFEETGTIHLFAASGLQVGLFAGLARNGARYLRLPRRWIALGTVPVVLGYCAITGFYPATVRATVTAVLLAVGFTLERPVAVINSLCGAGLLILLCDTQELFQTGFQLSFAAVLAILVAVRPLSHLLSRPFRIDPFFPPRLLPPWQRVSRKCADRACEALSLCLVCWAATLPILALHAHRISLIAIFANLLVVPLASMVMLLGVVAMTLAYLPGAMVVCLNNTSWLITKVILLILRAAIVLPGHCLNVSPVTVWQRDRITVLCEPSELVLHVHEKGRDWLVNTGKMSHWTRITEPYLQSQGINRIEKVVFFPSRPLQTETIQSARTSFGINEIVPASAGSLLMQLGKFKILVLPELSAEVVDALATNPVDVVLCGQLKTRHILRDSLFLKIAPSLVILANTKAGIATSSNFRRERFFYLKREGAITIERIDNDLFLHTFAGRELRLIARSR